MSVTLPKPGCDPLTRQKILDDIDKIDDYQVSWSIDDHNFFQIFIDCELHSAKSYLLLSERYNNSTLNLSHFISLFSLPLSIYKLL